MKSSLHFALILLSFALSRLNAQVLYSETFGSSLNTATATGGSNGNWIWSNNCTQSSATGHSAPGHALFSGSGCQFGNGSSAVAGALITPTIAVPGTGANLTFNYFLTTECQSPGFTCFYDYLSMDISTNGGSTWTAIMASNGSPSGLTETNAWVPVTYNLSSYLNQTITIRFYFNSIDGVANAYDGVYVDDIIVTGNCPIFVYGSTSTPTAPSICAGTSVTLTTNATSNYTWSTGSNASSVVVTPATTTVYAVSATSSLACNSTGNITITVSSGLPTLTVATQSNPICLGASTSFTASGALSYTWSGGVVNTQSFTPSATTAYTVTGANGCGTTTAVSTISVAPLAVSAVASNTDVCQGSLTMLTASAAANGYTWSPGPILGQTVQASPVSNTIYTVTASDGTCTGTQTLLITTRITPTITASASEFSICAGVTTTLTASGAGTGGTYSWSPGGQTTSQIVVTPIVSTPFVVYGTASNNCSSSAQQPVIIITTPTVNISTNKTIICSGSTVALTASGATSYTWANGPLTAAYNATQTVASMIYTVMGTSNTNTCVGTKTIQIAAVVPNVTVPSTMAICAGQTLVLTASGANTYTWNGVNVGASGTLAVAPAMNSTYVVTANTSTPNLNCYTTHTTQVTVNALPSITVVPTRSVICKGETNTLTASGASTYSWNTGSAAPTTTIKPNASGFYTVTAVDNNGCVNTLVVQAKVNTCGGIGEQNAASLLSVYPNPNNGNFRMLATETSLVNIYDELGKHVQSVQMNAENQYSADIRDLSAGLYFINIEQNGTVENYKIVVTK